MEIFLLTKTAPALAVPEFVDGSTEIYKGVKEKVVTIPCTLKKHIPQAWDPQGVTSLRRVCFV